MDVTNHANGQNLITPHSSPAMAPSAEKVAADELLAERTAAWADVVSKPDEYWNGDDVRRVVRQVYEIAGTKMAGVPSRYRAANALCLEGPGSAYGDAVWAFSLKGQLGPLWPPPPPQTVAGPTGPIVAGADTVRIAANNVEYSFAPARIRIKAGSTVTFTNVGDLPHSATSMERGKWDTGVINRGESKAITFKEPGNYFYICLPHPWQYGQVIVE